MTGEAIDPSEYTPEAQSGVEFNKPKDLKAAGADHPLFRRAIERNVITESDAGSGKTIPWNVPATVLKNMSDGLYEDAGATLREFESNGETATLKVERAAEEEYTDSEIESIQLIEDDYQPMVEVYYRKDKNKVIIRDNGKGMESATVLDVVRKIGATTGRNSGDLSGQFGMGLASFLKLIGLDNSMIMRTRSRITDESFSAYINLGGFDPIVGGLSEGDYGTEFEMVFSGDLNVDLRDEVETYSEWLRVPVHYEEYGSDGSLVFDEDWGGKRFEDTYDSSKYCAKFQLPGLLKVTMSSDAEGVTLLNSMPIDRNDGANHGIETFDAKYPFDVRILDESGAVVAIPDEDESYETDSDFVGMTPVSDAEYNIMSANQKEGFIRESEVPTDAITLPVPTSSRDSLQKNSGFWEFCAHMVNEQFKEDSRELYSTFDGKEDILNFAGDGLVTQS